MVLQPDIKALALQASPTESGQNFFSFPIPVSRARVIAALATLQARLWLQARPAYCTLTPVHAAALLSNFYALVLELPL